MLIVAGEAPEPQSGIPTDFALLKAIVDYSPRAKCRDMDATAFYPENVARKDREALAERLCDGCPIKGACLEYALQRETSLDKVHGIWGGTTPDQRKDMIRRRREAVAA